LNQFVVAMPCVKVSDSYKERRRLMARRRRKAPLLT
jgi:hypothetical protein